MKYILIILYWSKDGYNHQAAPIEAQKSKMSPKEYEWEWIKEWGKANNHYERETKKFVAIVNLAVGDHWFEYILVFLVLFD